MWDWDRAAAHAFVGAAVTTLGELLGAREASPLQLINSARREEAAQLGVVYRNSGTITLSDESGYLA